MNIDETTHGFADKVYDRAQLIELPLQRAYVVEYLEGEPYGDDRCSRVWDALRAIAPFGFRVLRGDRTSTYRGRSRSARGGRSRSTSSSCRRCCREVRGADSSLDEGLAAFLAVLGDEFPLARAKAEMMREDYAAHGFASYF